MQKASTSLLFQMAQVKIKKKNVNTLLHITDDHHDLSTSNTAFDTHQEQFRTLQKKKKNVSRGIRGKTEKIKHTSSCLLHSRE